MKERKLFLSIIVGLVFTLSLFGIEKIRLEKEWKKLGPGDIARNDIPLGILPESRWYFLEEANQKIFLWMIPKKAGKKMMLLTIFSKETLIEIERLLKGKEVEKTPYLKAALRLKKLEGRIQKQLNLIPILPDGVIAALNENTQQQLDWMQAFVDVVPKEARESAEEALESLQKTAQILHREPTPLLPILPNTTL